jgi:hypothetical protein
MGGTPETSGSLTITGIPDGFNGKFALVSKGTDKIASLAGTAIENSAVTLPIYKSNFGGLKGSYTGSDTVDVELCIADVDTAESSADSKSWVNAPIYLTFEAVTFENGAASVSWEDAFKAGFITITGFPEEYYGKFVVLDFLSSVKNGNNKGVISSNGEIKIQLYESKIFGKAPGYTGSDTINLIMFNVYDTAAQSGFASGQARLHNIAFDNGVAAVPWDSVNVAVAGSMTITNIPAKFNGKRAAIFGVQFSADNKAPGAINSVAGALTDGLLGNIASKRADGEGTIVDGVMRAFIYGPNFTTYNETEPKDITFEITEPGDPNKVLDSGVFKGVKIRRGLASNQK